MPIKKTNCHCCNGSGKEIDHKTLGSLMRRRRMTACLTQTLVADRMGLSKAYVHDLEQGDRNWRDELIRSYEKALK